MTLPLDSSLVDLEQNVNLIRLSSPFAVVGLHDDMYYTNESGGMVVLKGNYLDLRVAVTNEWYNVGVLFRDIDIKRGAVIQGARVKFFALGPYTDEIDIKIYARAVENTIVVPTDYEQALRWQNNQRTLAFVDWQLSDIWSTGGEVWTPDIKDVIQEVVQYSNWNRNNNIFLMFVVVTAGANRVREMYSSRYGSGQYKPLLFINYEED